MPDFQRKIAGSAKQNYRSSAVVIVRWDAFSKSEEYLEKHGKIHIYKMVKINSIYSEESKYGNQADEGSEVIFMLVGFVIVLNAGFILKMALYLFLLR